MLSYTFLLTYSFLLSFLCYLNRWKVCYPIRISSVLYGKWWSIEGKERTNNRIKTTSNMCWANNRKVRGNFVFSSILSLQKPFSITAYAFKIFWEKSRNSKIMFVDKRFDIIKFTFLSNRLYFFLIATTITKVLNNWYTISEKFKYHKKSTLISNFYQHDFHFLYLFRYNMVYSLL